jgi:hypothetical protein
MESATRMASKKGYLEIDGEKDAVIGVEAHSCWND